MTIRMSPVLAHGIPMIAVVGPFLVSPATGGLLSWLWWRRGKRLGRGVRFQLAGLVVGLAAIPVALGMLLLYLVMWILDKTGSILWPF